MKPFVKVLLIAALLIVAIKLSPVIFVGAFVGLFVAAILGVIGISLVAALAAVLLALVVAMSPVWIPVLAILGLVSLFRRMDRSAAPTAT